MSDSARMVPTSAMMSTDACPADEMALDAIPPIMPPTTLPPGKAAPIPPVIAPLTAWAPNWMAVLATALLIGTMIFSMIHLSRPSSTSLRMRMRSSAAASVLDPVRSSSPLVSFIIRPPASNAAKSPRNSRKSAPISLRVSRASICTPMTLSSTAMSRLTTAAMMGTWPTPMRSAPTVALTSTPPPVANRGSEFTRDCTPRNPPRALT